MLDIQSWRSDAIRVNLPRLSQSVPPRRSLIPLTSLPHRTSFRYKAVSIICCSAPQAPLAPGHFATLHSTNSEEVGEFWPQVTYAKAALPTLREGKSITFVGAISSRALKPGTAGLAAINAALEAMVPILASELRPTRVNAVVSGVVDTPWWSRVPETARKELFEQLAREVAVGRVGKPEDLASAIMFVTTNTFTLIIKSLVARHAI